jgi:flagellar basal-body rod protein FlgB
LIPQGSQDRPGTRCPLARRLHSTGFMFDPIQNRMEQYLDLLSTRQKLVASNIANLATPGYKTRDIDFQFEFESQLDGGAPTVIQPSGLTVKNDGNNVSLDRETRLLSENAMRFNFVTNLMKGDLRMLKQAIEEGK